MSQPPIKRISREVSFNRGTLLGKGGSAAVYEGTFKKQPAAVKRINVESVKVTLEREKKLHLSLEHSNVLKVFAVEKDHDFWYIVLELCKGTLDDVINWDYRKTLFTIPSDQEVLLQIVDGLGYLHSKNIIHNNVEPQNILISNDSKVKLSSFSVCKMQENAENSISGSRVSTLKWIAPELYEIDKNTGEPTEPTKASDIFATGLVFFVFLTQGIHPFGDINDSNEIDHNIRNARQIDIRERFSNFPIRKVLEDLICKMIAHCPENRMTLKDVKIQIGNLQWERPYPKPFTGKITFNRKKVLGNGAFGNVYEGTYGIKPVAVKRIEVNRVDITLKREIKLQPTLEHPNVLQTKTVEQDNDFWYIVLELCDGTLHDVINKKYKGAPLPSDLEVLYQIVDGLDYIHEKNIIHRDIKPQNILISKDSKIKLADFSFCKKLDAQSASSIGNRKGTPIWMAPELHEIDEKKGKPKNKATKASDVFATGLVFFVFLTRGIHPFGDVDDPLNIQRNIIKKTHTNDLVISNDILKNLTCQMIEHLPENRIALKDVKAQILLVIA